MPASEVAAVERWIKQKQADLQVALQRTEQPQMLRALESVCARQASASRAGFAVLEGVVTRAASQTVRRRQRRQGEDAPPPAPVGRGRLEATRAHSPSGGRPAPQPPRGAHGPDPPQRPSACSAFNACSQGGRDGRPTPLELRLTAGGLPARLTTHSAAQARRAAQCKPGTQL
eukprot:2404626-Prymnesium_polylepis.1